MVKRIVHSQDRNNHLLNLEHEKSSVENKLLAAEMDEKQIIELFFKRDQTAIAAASEKYSIAILSLTRNVLGDDGAAEECLNDTLMALWSNIPPERPRNLGLYLSKIVRNLALNRRKAEQAAKRGGGQYPAALEEISEIIASVERVEDIWAATYLQEQINRFLGTLPKDKRILFLMRYWYMDSIETIAKAGGITQSKVKMTLLRLRRDLKVFLEKEGIQV